MRVWRCTNVEHCTLFRCARGFLLTCVGNARYFDGAIKLGDLGAFLCLPVFFPKNSGQKLQSAQQLIQGGRAAGEARLWEILTNHGKFAAAPKIEREVRGEIECVGMSSFT